MIDWKIQYLSPKGPSRLFLNRLLYSLVSQGVEYNAGKYSGSYRIIPINPNEEIYQKEQKNKECTEKIADIVDIYSEFDYKTTQVGIDVSYFVSNEPIDFRVNIFPTENSKCVVEFAVTATEIQAGSKFISFVDLCATIFERLDFIFASYRNEYQDDIPTETSDILEESAQIVTFYSNELTDTFGRSKLLSAPSYELRELDDGSVMILACTDPQGCPEELQNLNNHLDFE